MKYIFCVSLLFLLITAPSCAPDYANIMRDVVQRALGQDFKEYYFFSYPTDNYGVGTIYRYPDKEFICDTWNCLGIKSENIPSEASKKLSINEFAAVGSGGTITISESQQNEIATELLLPKIYSVMSISGNIAKSDLQNIKVTINNARIRNLRKQEMINYIENLSDNSIIKQNYLKGKLIFVTSDIVIEHLSVDIVIQGSLKTNFTAAVGPGVSSKVFNDGQLGVKISDNTNGHYNLQIDNPVIVAVLTKKQPAAGVLGSSFEWENWEDIEIPQIKLK